MQSTQKEEARNLGREKTGGQERQDQDTGPSRGSYMAVRS